MNRYIKICMTVFILCVAVSCNRDEVFEKEQYKNVFALVSGSDNVSTWFHDLRKSESEGYVSVSMGGTNQTKQDLNISLVEDDRLIDAYNLNAFDVNTSKHISHLATTKYSIPGYNLTIPAGEVKASIPVKVNPKGLSPDSTYMIAFRVNTYSAYEVNPAKDYVLYQVRTKNWWSQQGGTTYNQRGNRLEVGSTANPAQVFGSKRVFPLTDKKVRVLAGTELNDKSDVNIYNRFSIVLTIGNEVNDSIVTIAPYTDVLWMNQIDGDPEFPNRAFVEDDGFKIYKTLLLCYEYKSSDGKYYTIKEELRLEFKEDPDDPRFLTK